MQKVIVALLIAISLQTQAQVQKKSKSHTVTQKKADAKLDEAKVSNSNVSKVEDYVKLITAEDMSKHLHILAADSMEGRNTGDRGQKMAALYIAGDFFMSGLNPVVPTEEKDKPSFYQTFNLVKKSWGELYMKANGYEIEFMKDFFIQNDVNIPNEIAEKLVFAGYGIEDEKYSDYKTINVKDKVVLILSGEPKGKDGKYLVTGTTEISAWNNNWRKKVALAKEKGAKHIIITTTDPKELDDLLKQYKIYLTQPSVSYGDKKNSGLNATFFVSPDAAKILTGFVKKPKKGDPSIHLDEKKWKKMVKKLNSGKVATIKGDSVKIKAERKEGKVDTENVLGLIEGTDKKDEIIVISAHYDHIGITGDGQVNNGADDDGSGTTAVLELSKAFAKAKNDGNGPRRSILFMTVTGEEKGLFGSRYYTENPVFPLKNTVADLNIDMIGRIDKAHEGNQNYIYLIGSDKLSSELHSISEKENNAHTQLQLDYKYNDPNDPNRFYYRSDHYNFAKNGIPVIFYFNGVHDDYHRPTDDVEKINFQKMEKITRLVFYTAWELANREERIKVDSNKK